MGYHIKVEVVVGISCSDPVGEPNTVSKLMKEAKDVLWFPDGLKLIALPFPTIKLPFPSYGISI